MKFIPQTLLAFISFSLAPLVALADGISLSPASWTAAQEVKLSEQGDGLRVKSLASSIWLAPAERIDYQSGDVVEFQYVLRGGNLIVQANWFNAEGNYLETATLGKTTSDKKQAMFRVAPSEKFSGAAVAYELKLWVEADMPSLTLESINVLRDVESLPLLTAQDFEKSNAVAVTQAKDGSLTFESDGSAPSVSILTTKRLSLKEDSRLSIDVLSVAPSSAFSLQAIFWSGSGEYLGYADLVTDETSASAKQVDVSTLEVPAQAASYSFKVWLSGSNAEAAVSISQGE